MSSITTQKEEITRLNNLIENQEAIIQRIMASSTILYGAHLFDVTVMYKMHIRLCQMDFEVTRFAPCIPDQEREECSDRAVAELKILLPKFEEAAAAFKKFYDDNLEFSTFFSKVMEKKG